MARGRRRRCAVRSSLSSFCNSLFTNISFTKIVSMTSMSTSARARLRKLAHHVASPEPTEQPPATTADEFVMPRGGLFVDDYSLLPLPTTDIERAKSDFDVYGYCIIQDVRLSSQACLLWSKLAAPACPSRAAAVRVDGLERPHGVLRLSRSDCAR